MNNFDLYKYINFIVSEDAYGNTFSPSEFDNLLKVKSISYHHELVKKYEVDMIETHSIRRFKTSVVKPVANGIVTLPEDYHYIGGLLVKFFTGTGYKWKTIDIVTDEEWNMRMSSSIKMPTLKHPIAKLTQNTFKVEPSGIENVQVSYLRKPIVPEFILELDSDDNPTDYTDTDIVELDFEDQDKIRIAHQILQLRGVNLKEPTLVEFAEIMNQKDKQ